MIKRVIKEFDGSLFKCTQRKFQLLGEININNEKRLKEIEEQLKKSSAEIFKQKPADIQKELEKEKTLGSPKNLIKPSDHKDD